MSPVMSTLGSRAMAGGLSIMLLSVSVGMHFGDYGLLLCYVGVLIGANLLTVAIRMADGPARIVPVVYGGAQALAAFVCRNTAAVGLLMASCAITVIFGEEDPVLCFAMFALLLAGLTLVNISARG